MLGIFHCVDSKEKLIHFGSAINVLIKIKNITFIHRVNVTLMLLRRRTHYR